MGPIDTLSLVSHVQEERAGATKQGIYKALRQLNKDKVVLINKKVVSLDVYWLKKVNRYVSTAFLNIQSNLKTPDSFVHLEEGDRLQLYFKTPEDMNRYAVNLDLAFIEMLPEVKNTFICNPHQIYIYKSAEEEQEVIKSYTEHVKNLFIVIGSKTSFDRGVVQALENDNVKFHFLARPMYPKANYYVGVTGDYIFETRHDKEVTDLIENFYGTHDGFNEKSVAQLGEIMKTPSRNRLTLSRNARKAEALRKKIGRHFHVPKN